MRNRLGAFLARTLAAVAAASLTGAARAGSPATPLLLSHPVADGVTRVYADGAGKARRVFVEDGRGRAFAVRVSGRTELRLEETQPPALPALRPNMLPDGGATRGTRNIRAAWLTEPTTRYAHGVLGDAIEAGGLAAETADGRVLEMRLPMDSVFEDRYPRLADIDGDGDDEILVVRSYLDRGAALAIVKAGTGGLEIVAETPAIGRANRWLNPIGVADFDGDGRPELALVETPHIGGVLKLYRQQDGRLTQTLSQPGVSNHAIGSRALGMAAILDANGDGVPDVLIPDQSHLRLLVLTHAGDRFRQSAAVPHPVPIVTDIAIADLDGNGAADAVYALADGTLVALLFGR